MCPLICCTTNSRIRPRHLLILSVNSNACKSFNGASIDHNLQQTRCLSKLKADVTNIFTYLQVCQCTAEVTEGNGIKINKSQQANSIDFYSRKTGLLTSIRYMALLCSIGLTFMNKKVGNGVEQCQKLCANCLRNLNKQV